MNKIIIGAIVVSALTGCNLIPKPIVNESPTNLSITIDTSYLKQKDLWSSLRQIHNFPEPLKVGEGYVYSSSTPVEDYTVYSGFRSYKNEPQIFLGKNTTTRSQEGERTIRMLDGVHIKFDEIQDGIYESTTISDYRWNRADPFAGGAPQVPDSYEHHDQLTIDAQSAIKLLDNTTSKVTFSIISPYSAEATIATFMREFNGRKGTGYTQNLYHGWFDFNEREYVFYAVITPYKNGSILEIKSDVPVLKKGNKYVYGSAKQTEKVKKVIEEYLEK